MSSINYVPQTQVWNEDSRGCIADTPMCSEFRLPFSRTVYFRFPSSCELTQRPSPRRHSARLETGHKFSCGRWHDAPCLSSLGGPPVFLPWSWTERPCTSRSERSARRRTRRGSSPPSGRAAAGVTLCSCAAVTESEEPGLTRS